MPSQHNGGMDHTDARGELLIDWRAENQQVVGNEGTTPTFQRHDQSSILHLMLATTNVIGEVRTWSVLEDESLSDHKYILTEMGETKRRKNKRYYTGWNLKKLDKAKLISGIREIQLNSYTLWTSKA